MHQSWAHGLAEFLLSGVDAERLQRGIDAIDSIYESIHSTLDPALIMRRALAAAVEAMRCETAAVSVRDGDRWVVTEVHGLPESTIGTVMSPDEEPHAALAIDTREPVAIDDAFTDQRVNREHMRRWGVRSVLVVPLLAVDQPLGVMFLNHLTAPHHFDDLEIASAKGIAAALTVALANARLHSKLQRELAERTSELDALTRIHALSGRLLESSELQPMLQEIMSAAIDLSDADRGTLQLVEHDSLRIVASQGHERPFLQFFASAEARASACGAAMTGGERVIVPDVETSELFAGTSSLDVFRAAHVRAIQSTPMISRTGTLLGILTTQWSVPRTPDEHELRRIDLLARQAADLIDLKRAEEGLKEADRRKNEFIAILSHELRNPLAPIRYAVPVIQSQHLDEPASRAVSIIQRQVEHLTRLVDDLLDVGRITSGKIELRRQQVTLRSIVTTALEAAAPALAAVPHTLNVAVVEEPIWLEADTARLAQVVTNLLDNSAKYTPAGGEISVHAGLENGKAVIRVRDTGIGIPVDAQATVFDMFRQVKRSDWVQSGLGIGLALSKLLVEMHDGTIEAHSGGPGLGAEFIVRLPISSVSAPGELSKPEETGVSDSRPLKVLVVDDNADLLEMLALTIEGEGHDVRKALNGHSAISVAAEFRPDVVLLDIGLPEMSGFDVARELKRRPETSHARLVALTGWGQPEDRRQTHDAGFDYHLTKPTDPEQLQRLFAEFAAADARSEKI